VTLQLQTQAGATISTTVVDSSGFYTFTRVADRADGYEIVFAQERNSKFQGDQVAPWAWLGPVPMVGGASASLPDLEISSYGLKPLAPSFDATFGSGEITAARPITLSWPAHPGAVNYWVDLLHGPEMQPVWQSASSRSPSAAWNGTLNNGQTAGPGEYWWGIGAVETIGQYRRAVYSWLSKLVIEPATAQ
jgi:hypothetical protein